MADNAVANAEDVDSEAAATAMVDITATSSRLAQCPAPVHSTGCWHCCDVGLPLITVEQQFLSEHEADLNLFPPPHGADATPEVAKLVVKSARNMGQ